MIIIQAKLTNPIRSGAPPVVVPFPVKDYEGLYRRLADAGIGAPVERDCRVEEIGGPFEVLSALQGKDVNADELDYLAKRLESFSGSEARQFSGTAAAMGINGIEDFINLTFCCRQATVISDFSDLPAIGREHYLNKNGGCAPMSELDALDAGREARELIQKGTGTVTPYGVVYDNGMELERLYKGREFPAYQYEQCVLAVGLERKSAPDEGNTWLYLPMPEVCVKRALERGGFTDPGDMSLEIEVIGVSSDIFRWIDPAMETPEALNETAKAIAELDDGHLKTLCAAAEYVEPTSASVLRQLAERIDLFEFYPGVSTSEEYGRYMIAESGRFKYDAELDEFYDFEGYGKWRLRKEQGAFLDGGYICYNGNIPLAELLSQSESAPGQSMAMGGL